MASSLSRVATARRSCSFSSSGRSMAASRRPLVVEPLAVSRPAPQQVNRRVDGRAPEVGRRDVERPLVFAPGKNAQKHGLQDVLGVSRISGDPQGRAEYRLVVPRVQLGKPGRHGRGSHLDEVAHLQAGRPHVARLTYLDAREGRLLHGGRKN